MNKPYLRVALIAVAYLLIIAMAYLGYATRKGNLTDWFLILTALAYGFGGPYLVRSTLKKESLIQRENQDRSLWLIIPGFLFVFYASPIEYIYALNRLPRSTGMQIAALVLLFMSITLFSWARITLGDFYSGRARVTDDHVLIQRGPYRFIRHPAYAAYLIMGVGITIGYSSWFGLAATLFIMLPALVYRIHVEEELLFAGFGDDFLQYSQKTRRLIPYIW